MKMIPIYDPCPDDEIVMTANGGLKWLEFLQNEKMRIERNPKRKATVMSRLGYSWLIANKVAGVPSKAPSCNWRKYMPRGQKHVSNGKVGRKAKC